MNITFGDNKYGTMGNSSFYRWNKKMCFQSRDTLYDCMDQQENDNKYRCPDELYAYEMWCPSEFQLIHKRNRLFAK